MLNKNWPAICEIPDPRVRLAICMLDLDTEFGVDVAKRFPEYIGGDWTEDAGAIPLSVIKELTTERMLKEADAGLRRRHAPLSIEPFAQTYEVLKDLKIPDFLYGYGVNDLDATPLPEELAKAVDAKFGDLFEYQGAKLVLMEKGSCWLVFCPAERIALDK